jgi:hypothetical protein
MSNEPTHELQALTQARLIDRKNFQQGNTWMVCQNNDFVFQNGYDGPLMPGMIVMYQTKARTPFRNKHSYGIDRYFYRIEKINSDEGDMVGKILETCTYTQDSDDESDCMSSEDESVNIPNIKSKIIGDALQVDYPTHSRGVMQCYSRVSTDSSFVPHLIRVDKDGNGIF